MIMTMIMGLSFSKIIIIHLMVENRISDSRLGFHKDYFIIVEQRASKLI